MTTVKYKRVAELPVVVRGLCHSHGSWVVGGGARYLLGLTDETPRDWDILVPLAEWPVACKSMPEGTPTNSQGGLKLDLGPALSVDVWGDDLARFLIQVPAAYLPAYAVHPRSMTSLCVGRSVERHKADAEATLDAPTTEDLWRRILSLPEQNMAPMIGRLNKRARQAFLRACQDICAGTLTFPDWHPNYNAVLTAIAAVKAIDGETY